MRRYRPSAIVGLALCLCLGLAASTGRAGGQATPATGRGGAPTVLPPDQPAYGTTYGEWTARQWQWLLSFPNPISPYGDEGGERCGYGQSGPVFFLTGTSGDPNTPRDCVVPAGTALLVPLLAGECSTVQPPPLFGRDEAELAACAAALVDQPLRLGATLNGEPIPDLERYRVRSPLFSVALPADNRLGAEPGVAALVSDGYWLLLAPLPPGQHVLRTGVALLDRDQEGGTTYRLTVAAPAPSATRPGVTPAGAADATPHQ